MCEPAQSIVQFPVEDCNVQKAVEAVVAPAIAKVEQTCRLRIEFPQGSKIGPFLNYSIPGHGHSETIGQIFGARHPRLYLPNDIKYETYWWNRTVHLDGPISREVDKEASFYAATRYADRVVNSNLPLLRRFLEASLTNTQRPIVYISNILDLLLTVKGQQSLERKLKRLFYGKKIDVALTLENSLRSEELREKVIGIILSVTRVRENLNDAWADDSLWR